MRGLRVTAAVSAASLVVGVLAACTASGPGPTPVTTPAARPTANATTPPAAEPVLIAATAEPPRVERRIVGADDPGIAEQLYDINNELSARFFDSLVQAEWRKDAEPHAQVVLRGPVDEAALQLLDAAPLQVEVVIVTDGPTWDESNAVTMRLFDRLRLHDPTGQAGGHYDEVEGVYSISYSAASPIDPDALAGLADGAAVELWYGGSEVPPGTGPQPTTRAE